MPGEILCSIFDELFLINGRDILLVLPCADFALIEEVSEGLIRDKVSVCLGEFFGFILHLPACERMLLLDFSIVLVVCLQVCL